MGTHLDIDPELFTEAQRLGGHKTKRAAVHAALEEYVQKLKGQQTEPVDDPSR